MPIPTIPTPAEIKARIVSDLNDKLNQNTPSLFKAFNRVLAGSIAGLIHLLYQAILWVYAQIFPSTADERSLKLLGALIGIFPLEGVFAVLTADISGTDSYVVASGILFQVNGTVFKVTTGGTISGGTVSAVLTCQTSGDVGNLANGTVLDIVSPDSDLLGTATVTATTTSGDNPEDLDSFRSRVISGYRKRRTGGAPADYEAWGLETPNFDWISALDAPTTIGEVQVYGRVDNQTDGIPTGNQLDELYEYLTKDPDTGLRTRHPIGPDVIPLPISRKLFDIEIFIQNGTPEIESNIESAVTQHVENQEPYNEAIHFIKKDTISEGSIASAGNDVANVDGATIISVVLTAVSPSLVVQSWQLFGGEFAKVNSITFTPVV
jgi:uncharacterized phage protein gp47/JayE